MKKIALLFCLLVSATTWSQHSCCSISTTQQFAMLSSDNAFMSSHLAPLPFHFSAENGKMITFKTSDGKLANAYEVKPAKPSGKVLFIIHEWWGLNDYIKQEAAKYQTELGDVTVYALDLYDGKVATTPEEAGKYMGEVKEERAVNILKGAIDFVGKNAQIYTLGWCFGGGWSLQASLLAGKQAAGCVMYYGMPESNLAKLKTLHSDVLGIFAAQDKWITPAVVAEFEKNMKAAGKKLTVKSYDADHAFANPSNPKYNKEFSAQAHTLVLAFFKEHLKK
jgi:carboxymethylenebutenolidase